MYKIFYLTLRFQHTKNCTCTHQDIFSCYPRTYFRNYSERQITLIVISYFAMRNLNIVMISL